MRKKLALQFFEKYGKKCELFLPKMRLLPYLASCSLLALLLTPQRRPHPWHQAGGGGRKAGGGGGQQKSGVELEAQVGVCVGVLVGIKQVSPQFSHIFFTVSHIFSDRTFIVIC